MNQIFQRWLFAATAFCLTVWGFCPHASGQGTMFTYQGRLNDNGSAANGKYDLRFAIYDSTNSPGTVIAGPVTNSAVAVSNGMFAVNLDFGSGVFTGPARWLDIGVRTNGNTGAFTVLSPRQPLLPVPYAIFANGASNLFGPLAAAQLTGTLPATALAGYTNTVALTNGGNLFAGTFNGSFAGAFNGAFAGDGGNVTNVNTTHLTGILTDNQLPSNTAFLNSNQTFSANNYFSGSNTFTNLYGNSFSGSFFGNGLVGWVPTNGTSIPAQIDHGYLLTNSLLATVTLPASAHPGDIVRISGAGAGGWLVQETSGQSILGNFASYRNSYSVGATVGNYLDVAASVDGARMYAVGNGFTGVQASSNSGQTWAAAGLLGGNYQSVACSANGRVVWAVSSVGGVVESTNSGGTWSTIPGSATTISCTADGSEAFTGNIACSGNGTFLAKFSSTSISVSTNAGVSWFGISAPATSGLSCLAVSGDCARLVAGVNNGLLYGSSNLGATWTAITTSNQVWSGVWMSQDGSRFAATVSTSGGTTGGLYDYGVYVLPATVSTNSTISGSQGTAVELQCIGNNQWMPVSSSGTLWAY